MYDLTRLLFVFFLCFLGSSFLSRCLLSRFLSRFVLSFHRSFEVSENTEITESSLLYLRQIVLRLFLSGFLSSLGRCLFALLPCTEVRNEDTLSVAVELDYLERQFVAHSNRRFVFLLEVTCGAECLNALFEDDNSALVGNLSYLTIDNLEGEFLANSDGSLVFLLEVTGGAEAFYSVVERDNSALVGDLGYSTLVDRVDGEDVLQTIPRVVLQLLVTLDG